MIRMNGLILMLVLSVPILTGCATIFTGPTQTVQLVSRESGTSIYINEKYVGDDEAFVSLQKSRNYNVRGEKQGCRDANLSLDKGVNPVTFINIFIWPGFIVDAATGSWYQFQQEVYAVTPRC